MAVDNLTEELTDRIVELETLLRHALPVLSYVSHGKGYTGSLIPYPDAAARRLLPLVEGALGRDGDR